MELVVVLAIMSVLTAIAIAAFGGSLAKNRIDAASARLASDIRLVQTSARTRSESFKLAFDLAADQYDATPDPTDAWTSAVDFSLAPYRTDIVNAVFGTSTHVTIDASGAPVEPGWVVLAIGDLGVVVKITESGVSTSSVASSDPEFGWDSLADPEPPTDPIDDGVKGTLDVAETFSSSDLVRTNSTDETKAVTAAKQVRSE